MKDLRPRTATSLILGALFFISFMYLPPFYFSLILAGIVLQIIIFEWKNLFDLRKPIFWALMPAYPILPFALLITLNQNPAYRPLLLLLFILVAAHDTGSYCAGSAFGKHKIAPSVSPGKSWEGFLGGYLAALALVHLMLFFCANNQPIWFTAPFVFFSCALSFSGDLFESWLKRRVSIKDAGDILPGHGGFLDRFDGILFAVFFFYLFRETLSSIFIC